MTRRGVDYAWSRPYLPTLWAAGYDFVCRYLSYDASKNLTLGEARTLAENGFDIVANWEANTEAALDGYTRGVQDASAAWYQARECGIPAGRPIYFSVDFDAHESQQPAINQYLLGAGKVLGQERVGIYAGYYVAKRAHEARVAPWVWQTYAWSGGQWLPYAHIRQVKNEAKVAGADVDIDTSDVSDFGQWRPGGAAPVPAPVTNGESDMYRIYCTGHTEQFLVTGDGLRSITARDAEILDHTELRELPAEQWPNVAAGLILPWRPTQPAA